MTPTSVTSTRWLRCIAISGVTATGSYVAVALLNGPPSVLFAVASSFAISLSIGSVAIWQVLATTGNAASVAMLAALSNVVAAALFVAMVAVQLAVKEAGDPPDDAIRAVYWGLDVAWDLYIGAGTIGFGIAVAKSAAFRLLAAPGVVVGTALLVLNVVAFPEPPGTAGLVDIGPLVGLWYTGLTVRAILLLGGTPPAGTA
jgi:hypothetical protein